MSPSILYTLCGLAVLGGGGAVISGLIYIVEHAWGSDRREWANSVMWVAIGAAILVIAHGVGEFVFTVAKLYRS